MVRAVSVLAQQRQVQRGGGWVGGVGSNCCGSRGTNIANIAASAAHTHTKDKAARTL